MARRQAIAFPDHEHIPPAYIGQRLRKPGLPPSLRASKSRKIHCCYNQWRGVFTERQTAGTDAVTGRSRQGPRNMTWEVTKWWLEEAAKLAPVVTALMALAAFFLAWRTLRVNRRVARERAAIDFATKMTTDKDVLEQRRDLAEAVDANPDWAGSILYAKSSRRV